LNVGQASKKKTKTSETKIKLIKKREKCSKRKSKQVQRRRELIKLRFESKEN